MHISPPNVAVGLGTIAELWANDRFLVREEDAAWVVVEGTLDLFVQEVKHGTRTSALAHLFRVTAGEAVFGFGGRPAPSLVIVACPSPGAKVARTTQGELRARWTTEADDTVVRWIDGWIAALALATGGGAVPTTDVIRLDPDQEVTVDDGPRAVAPRTGVLWLKPSEGTSWFLARPEATIGATYFPVSVDGWVQAHSGTVCGVQTRRWLERDPEWAAFRRFHRLVLDCLAVNARAAEERQRSRMRAKANASAAVLRSAMWKLSSSLRRRRAPAERAEIDADPVMAACQAVGAVLDISLVHPAGWAPGTHSPQPIETIARASGVRVRRVLLRDRWWTREAGPLVAIREADARPVALLPRGGRRYVGYDPVERTSTPVDPAVAATLSSIAYTFYRPFPEKPIKLVNLLSFGLAGSRRDLALIVGMGLGAGVLNLAAPVAMGIIFDSAIPGAQRGQVISVALFLAIAAVSAALFALTRNFATLRLQGRLDATLQPAVWDRLLRLPVPFFREYSSGDLAVRSLAFNDIRQVLAGPTLSLIVTQLFSLLSFGLLFVYSVPLAFVATVLVAVTFAVSAVVLFLYVGYSRHAEAARGRVAGMTAELVQGVAKFRMSGAEAKALAAWARETADRKHFAMKASRAERAMMVFNAAWPIVCYAVIFHAASTLAGDARAALTTGSLLAFLALFTHVMTGGLQFAHQLFPVLGLIPVYERARPLLVALPEAGNATAPPGDLTGAIEVNHVTFRYSDDGPLVLRDVSFRVSPGEMVAIVGSSGCGKSTLLRLLLRFEKPQSGGVYYDRQDLAGLDVAAVRRQIGVVLQGTKFGSGTLLNIIVGSTGRTVNDAWEAARMTGLDQDIAEMPMGIHTVVSDAGDTLSGGQRQRLMIARAVVNKPRLLLFDEATSALDNQTQALVTRSLDSLRATRIVIAHRLSTITRADRILVLDQGRILQAGTYADLMAQDGPFRELASRQVE